MAKKLLFLSQLLLFLLLGFPGVRAQQSNLSCSQTAVPFVNSSSPSFTVTESHSNTGLSAWGGFLNSNPTSQLIDNNLTNFTSGAVVLSGSLTISVTDASNVYSSGDFAGFVISSGLLSVSALSSITIRTYLNGVLQETNSSNNLVAAGSSISGAYEVGFYSNTPFNKIELTINDALGAGTYNVYYAILRGTGGCTSAALQCNVNSDIYFPRFAAIVDPSKTGTTGIVLSSLTNTDRLVDTDTTNYASLTTTLSATGTAFVAVKDVATNYPPGTFAGFDIENSTLLNASLLSNITLKTYRDGVFQEQSTSNSLVLGASVLGNSNRQKVGFVTTDSFDEVQLVITQPVGISLGTTRIYNAIFKKFCVGPSLICNTPTNIQDSLYPVYINGVRTGITGTVCALCSVTNTGNVIDSSKSSFATITLTGGVAASGNISVKDALTKYPAGTFAGFDVGITSILSANVISNLSISTYRNDTLQQTFSGGSLLVGLSSTLLTDSNRSIIGSTTTQAFDEVRLTVSQPVSVSLGAINVYSTTLTRFCSTPLQCNTLNLLTIPAFPVYIDAFQTGATGAVCGLCSVTNANNVITASTSDSAQLKTVAGVAANTSLAVKNGINVFPAGTLAGFVVQDPNSFIEVSLLKTVTVSTLLNGVVQETKNAGSLLDVSAIVLQVNTSTGKYALGIRTTLPYDEVKISLTPIVGVAPMLNVFGAFVDTRYADSVSTGVHCVKPPLTEPDHTATNINQSVNGSLKTNDRDPANLHLTYNTSATTNPVNGTVTIDAQGNYVYTPASNYVGADSFQYTTCNDSGLCSSQWAYVSIFPVRVPGATNHKPAAQDDLGQTMIDVPVGGTVKRNDNDPDGDTLSYSISSNPAHGTLTLTSNGNYLYTPDSSFIGVDTAKVNVCDNGTPPLCTTTSLLLVVSPNFTPTGNNPPYGQDDVYNTPALTPVSGNVLTNDTDPNGDPLTATFLDTVPSSKGVFTITSNGGFSFVPAIGFTGSFPVRYQVCDNASPSACDTATLVINVQPVLNPCLNVRIYLEGALISNGNATATDGRPLMRDNLRNSTFSTVLGANFIPVKDPYEFATTHVNVTSKYTKLSPQSTDYPQFQQVTDSATVFGVSGQNAIVDWVFVELRNKANRAQVMATRSALLQRDGDIVEVNGTSCLSFPGVPIDSYYVAVRHRSHLGAMTLYAQSNAVLQGLVDMSLQSTPIFDFGTTLGTFDYTGLATNNNVKTGYRALWQGDFNADKKIKVNNPAGDDNILLFDVLNDPGNVNSGSNYNFSFGYYQGDYNMDSKDKYDNPNGDSNNLLFQVINYPQNTSSFSNFNFLIQQLP